MFCSKCGRELSPEEGDRFCTSCGNPLSRQEPQDSCPWENLEDLGFLEAVGATLRQTLFEPVRFFSSMPIVGGWLQPLLYAILIGTIGNLSGYVVSSLFEFPFMSQVKPTIGKTLLFGVLIPLLVGLGTILWSVILHGSVFLFGAKNKPFEATVRIVSYSTSPDIFNFIPTLGWIIAAGWKLVLIVIGVREVHKTSTGRAVLVTLFPFLLIWGIIFVLMLFIMATAVFGLRSF